jgi:PKHD-type hydroxylase
MVYKKLINFALSRNFLLNSSIKLDKFLQDEEIEKINSEILKNVTLEPGVIGIQKERESRRLSDVCFIDYRRENSWLFEKINSVIEKINEEYYNFDLNGYDYIQYSEYNSEIAGHYNAHIDLTTDIIPGSNYDFLTRKLSFSIMLNDDYEEGEFFMNLGEKFNVPLKRGDMLIFPSFILHGVNPVKTGTRKSLVGWVTGPKFK